jgi:DNA replication and repair protein RecF
MQLNSLSILNFKNIISADLQFSSKINCFIGDNGMGKTNVLDAIYYLSFCKSHSSAIDSQNINHEADFFMIQGKYSVKQNEEEIMCGMKRRQKKQFKRNKKEYERLSDHIGLLPLVLVSPDDASLISDGSDERRKFMDGVISQFNHTYLEYLINYNNALQQRNALLKQENLPETALFEIWEEKLSFFGTYIYEQRRDFISQFVPIFNEYYAEISQGVEQAGLTYQSALENGSLSKMLAETRERDRLIGYTTRGIHRDEIELTLGNYPLKRVGSQGQAKTCLISLKLAQFNFLKRIHNLSPILLLDDIFDKLDSKRVKKIVELVAGHNFGQIFITDTNREHLDQILIQIDQSASIFMVHNGEISKDSTFLR